MRAVPSGVRLRPGSQARLGAGMRRKDSNAPSRSAASRMIAARNRIRNCNFTTTSIASKGTGQDSLPRRAGLRAILPFIVLHLAPLLAFFLLAFFAEFLFLLGREPLARPLLGGDEFCS